ncbi:anti-sigma factor [Cryobacterium sp. Y57]|uniref:anti-sigma factor n=1 Tax=Cryobacterium sp. Y57 TaxID=2048287 RepID=UPI000CE31EDA|nr:anti-sigma factor [Cryobacterium sp. Y57]
MSRSDEQNPADLAGAYALHALDADDMAIFEAHLAESKEARIEAAELTDIAVALGLAVAPVQPSDAVKANLMAMLSSTPQLPPLPASRTTSPSAMDVAAADPGASPAGPSVATATPGTEGPAATGAGTTAEPRPESDIHSGNASSTPRPSTATERAQARWFKRPSQFILAIAAAVALFVGGISLGQALNSNEFKSQQAASLAQINAANDSQRAATTTVDGQEVTLVWSNTLGISALLVDNLPALPSDQDYQLWYMNDGDATSAGTFDSSGDGTVWRVLDGTMHTGDQVGVTVEPTGGSDQPTSNPIVALQS